MSAQRYRIDTNVLLRFLLNDHKEHSPASKSLFDAASAGRCTIVLDAIVVAEAVWVLTSFYKTNREDIADAIGGIITKLGVECQSRDVVLDALDRFSSKKVDFTDCYLAAQAASGSDPVVSFDSDFRKFKDIVVLQPGSAARTN